MTVRNPFYYLEEENMKFACFVNLSDKEIFLVQIGDNQK